MNSAIRWSAGRRCIVLGWLVLAAWSSTTVAGAQDVPFTGVVVDEQVELHSGPGKTYVTGSAPAGTLVRVEQVDHGWYKIVPPAGSYSFVSRVFIDAQGDGKSGVTNHNYVAVKAVNQGDRGYSYRTQTSLSKGQQVRILGEYGSFYMIAPPRGAFVYVPASSVRRASAAEIESATKVEEKPTAEAPRPEPEPAVVTPVEPATPEVVAPAEVAPTVAEAPVVVAPRVETPAPVEPIEPVVAVAAVPEPAPVEPVMAAPEPVAAPAPEVASTGPEPVAAPVPEVASTGPEPVAAPVLEVASTAPMQTTPAETVVVAEPAPNLVAEEPIAAAEPAAPPVPEPLPMYGYDEAEQHFSAAVARPADAQVEDRLIASYEALARDDTLTEAQRRWANDRLTELNRRQAVAAALARIKTVREAPLKPVIAVDSSESPQTKPMMRPDAVGWLLASSIYNGQRLPRLYRLVDPENQRTLAYVKPGPDIDEAHLLGKLLAVRGATRLDPSLNVQVIEVREARVVQRAN